MSRKHSKAKRLLKQSPFQLKPVKLFQRRTAPGASPGTLVADPEASPPQFHLITFSKKNFQEWSSQDPTDLPAKVQADEILWINVDGLGHAETLQKVGETYGIHPLALEDVVNVHQRPKLESYGKLLFIVARMPHDQSDSNGEQVSFFLGENLILTFQEGLPGDTFEPVRERLRGNIGKLRGSGADYLLYALLDALIDHYFPILERYASRLEDLEDEILEHPHNQLTSEIYTIRRQLLGLRRAIRPMRDVINSLIRGSLEQISDEVKLYLRDCYDHTIQLMDMLDTYREVATSLMEMALASASHRLNEIMRFLTVMSSIFIPLTFIVGVYGMNFKTEISPWNMPELDWYYGYPFALGLMVLTVVCLLLFFKYKGWLGIPRRLDEDGQAITTVK
ncbi:magnesium and cobalt transport protein CorA [bacterium (Candidatus Blackallbacteria) CG17_big_fil_post_rev_8_21_14_2_50_48_46]|uniref:Magnesium transport protein CorA n=1 Tax=bacterium (Candidatus Blackallbacteria) CG17_big_fil_post_rev_8_21_14_2_50_48_46 TaxID=2014261 RepID=A0A2M7G3F0_9BACT|nr:MAG: magnesium and cobalt transport protein CorA [bacterium (Candidatus Blackallbacteria) CG18_big_fil_WC_8_21_14_2_50_49_26]PIW16356.1 MAG: magnesium and cobalt transport protein CorA [bacterium (Candidatus Blackallbacteria) CG17_big_fil_post_rev_8_21_14_2_50_48_46]PIW45370.1 MAG: magnesium and cobalt transport protein CorA [bacterium (Candidatus Blackallbacteria) CG13_big_fil_rev_8_21_14_2_50_49_14]